jgi:hypothetical protein
MTDFFGILRDAGLVRGMRNAKLATWSAPESDDVMCNRRHHALRTQTRLS